MDLVEKIDEFCGCIKKVHKSGFCICLETEIDNVDVNSTALALWQLKIQHSSLPLKPLIFISLFYFSCVFGTRCLKNLHKLYSANAATDQNTAF